MTGGNHSIVVSGGMVSKVYTLRANETPSLYKVVTPHRREKICANTCCVLLDRGELGSSLSEHGLILRPKWLLRPTRFRPEWLLRPNWFRPEWALHTLELGCLTQAHYFTLRILFCHIGHSIKSSCCHFSIWPWCVKVVEKPTSIGSRNFWSKNLIVFCWSENNPRGGVNRVFKT